MRAEAKKWLKTFLIELGIYGALVAGYFFLVLHSLGPWLQRLYSTERRLYAAAALVLIIAQGILLEVITRVLLALIQKPMEEE